MLNILSSALFLQALSLPVLAAELTALKHKHNPWDRTVEISAHCPNDADNCPSFKCKLDKAETSFDIPQMMCDGANGHKYQVSQFDWSTRCRNFVDMTDASAGHIEICKIPANKYAKRSPVNFTDYEAPVARYTENLLTNITTTTHHKNSTIMTHHSKNTTTTHRVHSRDSITIDISSQMNNSSVSNAANDAKFEVINNAKNANIAMGDRSNHTASLQSFGDKNMMNSTGSNTGGWNTKNRGSNLNSGNVGDENNDTSISEKQNHDKMEKRHVNGGVNLTFGGKVSGGSEVTDVGSGNTIELFIGEGNNIVNVTITLDVDGSRVDSMGNNNVVRVHFGDISEEEVEVEETVVIAANQTISV